MKIRVLTTPRAAARRAAEEIARLLRRRRQTRLVLASGNTMVPVYEELVRLHRLGEAPFRRAETFNLDELRVPSNDPRSFRTFMKRYLFSKVDLPGRQIHFLDGAAADPDAECRRYEAELARGGPADVALVGIGVNGHVAYVEPGPSLAPRTSLVRLSASTVRRLADQGMRPVPRQALTMGIETILEPGRILLVATGKEKAEVVAAALRGRVTARCPASLLSLHPALTVVLDRAAAGSLQR
ncbi:MAG TPA: glucosamine-6-phosphate deaminase [Thermoanaerobaculia bacterium]|nr:glucosamine-6-phosphate deaminase [Thermoanaerobaculia bacterium]